MTDNPSGEIPTTIHTGDQLIKQAEVLNDRIINSPDVKIILDLTQKLRRGTMFNTIYSIVLTLVVVVLSVIGYNVWQNSHVVAGIVSNCEQDNLDKEADLATWRFIVTTLELSEEKGEAIISQRETADRPVDCRR